MSDELTARDWHLCRAWIDRSNWIHRRIDAVKFTPDGDSRAHISLDLTVPRYLVDDKVALVPLILLPKTVLESFDLRDSEGRSVPLATRAQGTEFTFKLSLAFASLFLPWYLVENEDFLARLYGVVASPSRLFLALESGRVEKSSEHWFAELESMIKRWSRPWPKHETSSAAFFLRIVSGFVLNYPAFGLLPASRAFDRQIIKVAYTLPITGRPDRLSYSNEDLYGASSWHFELCLPPQVLPVPIEAIGTPDVANSVRSSHSNTHVSAKAVSPDDAVHVRYGAIGRPVPLALPIALGTLAVCCVGLAISAGYLDPHVQLSDRGTPATVAVVAPALLLTWTARTPEHAVVRRASALGRWLAAINVAVLMLVAVVMALTPRGPARPSLTLTEFLSGSPDTLPPPAGPVLTTCWALLALIQLAVVVGCCRVSARALVPGRTYTRRTVTDRTSR